METTTTSSSSTDGAKPPSALSVPNFRLLLINNLGYLIVGNALRFTFGWLVLDGLNRSEGWQGLVAFTLGIPVTLLILQAGVWADRYDRRMLLMISQAGALVVMVGTTLLVAAGSISMTWIIILTLASGAMQALGQPIRAALIPLLVAPNQLFNAIAVNAIAMTLSMILGPVLAKMIGDAFGFEGAFGFQAALLAVGMLALIPLRIPPHDRSQETAEEADRSIRRRIAEGFAHVLGHDSLKRLFLLLVVAGFTINAAVMVNIQALVKDLGRDAGEAGPLFALMGVGLAISSAIVMKKGDMKRKGAAFMRAMMTGSTCVVFMGQVPGYGWLFPLMLVMGMAGGFYINMNQGLIQAHTPEHLMGRVMALYALVSVGLMPIGALVIGLIAERIGAGTIISLAGAISFVVVLATYLTSPDLRELR